MALSDADKAAFEAEGRRPHWRFKLDHDAPIEWQDLIRGPQHLDPALLGDPVIRRADGSWLYMLPSAVDDIEMGVTHVVRGEDHVTNTGLQLQMFDALGAARPAFAHAALADRIGGQALEAARLAGRRGDARGRGSSRRRWSPSSRGSAPAWPVEPLADPAPLIESFDFASFGRAPARFDMAELEALNARIVHQLDFDAVRERLPAGMSEADWTAIRPNVAKVADAADWWEILHGHVEQPCAAEDRDYLAAAAEAAAAIDWGESPWAALTARLKETSGRTGKALFHPLRRALTGRDSGPDMAALLPLIGREEAVARLRAAALHHGAIMI